jgi:hypothetical protein
MSGDGGGVAGVVGKSCESCTAVDAASRGAVLAPF